ncbi:hypothetical protein BH10ACT10_BH10ACT10_17270 [soil metagenome]
MHRQLRALDRYYAHESPRAIRRGDGRRRFLVGSATAVVAVLVTGHVLDAQGVDIGLSGIHTRRGDGPTTVEPGSGSYRFIAHQPGRPEEAVTYDACRTIRVVVNDRIAPSGADALLDQAIAEVSRSTGLSFRRDGRTDEQPRHDRPTRDPARYGGGWSPVVVGWTTPRAEAGLRGAVVGLGGSTRVVDTRTGRSFFVTGAVSLDTPALVDVLALPDGSAEVRAVLMHELGHVVGVAHVEEPSELMNARGSGVTEFGPGDLTGLAALGRGHCGGPR